MQRAPGRRPTVFLHPLCCCPLPGVPPGPSPRAPVPAPVGGHPSPLPHHRKPLGWVEKLQLITQGKAELEEEVKEMEVCNRNIHSMVEQTCAKAVEQLLSHKAKVLGQLSSYLQEWKKASRKLLSELGSQEQVAPCLQHDGLCPEGAEPRPRGGDCLLGADDLGEAEAAAELLLGDPRPASPQALHPARPPLRLQPLPPGVPPEGSAPRGQQIGEEESKAEAPGSGSGGGLQAGKGTKWGKPWVGGRCGARGAPPT
ncbi:hypothetical protein E2320_022651 [Naja naja]|nr:hypothetical protein E2320_022651 [Naja naja]